MTMRVSLVVMAKWPEAGQSKTRLAQELGADQALGIARVLLADTLFRLGKTNPAAFAPPSAWPVGWSRFQPAFSNSGCEVGLSASSETGLAPLAQLESTSAEPAGNTWLKRVLAYCPADARNVFAELAGPDFVLSPQTPGDLGWRLQTILLHEWSAGQDAVVFLGTDSPTLPIEYIRAAVAWLKVVEVVIGPACDGGYYLFAARWSLRWISELQRLGLIEQDPSSFAGPQELRCRLPALLADKRFAVFEAIDWGSPRVLEQTIQRLQRTRLRWKLLPVWYDVDTASDWAWLAAHACALELAGQACGCPNLVELAGGGGFDSGTEGA